MLDRHKQRLEYAAGRGFWGTRVSQMQLRLSQDIAGGQQTEAACKRSQDGQCPQPPYRSDREGIGRLDADTPPKVGGDTRGEGGT
jgi:hypothetical protein